MFSLHLFNFIWLPLSLLLLLLLRLYVSISARTFDCASVALNVFKIRIIYSVQFEACWMKGNMNWRVTSDFQLIKRLTIASKWHDSRNIHGSSLNVFFFIFFFSCVLLFPSHSAFITISYFSAMNTYKHVLHHINACFGTLKCGLILIFFSSSRGTCAFGKWKKKIINCWLHFVPELCFVCSMSWVCD